MSANTTNTAINSIEDDGDDVLISPPKSTLFANLTAEDLDDDDLDSDEEAELESEEHKRRMEAIEGTVEDEDEDDDDSDYDEPSQRVDDDLDYDNADEELYITEAMLDELEGSIKIAEPFKVEEGSTFVFPDDLDENAEMYNSSNDYAKPSTELTVSVLTDAEIVAKIAEYEPDEERRHDMMFLAGLYNRDLKLALLETLEANSGGSPKINDVIQEIELHMTNAMNSKSLKLRNKATSEHLQHYHNLAVSVSRVMRNTMKDDPIASLKIDGIAQHSKTLNEQLHTLASSIYAMQEIVLGKTIDSATYDQPINLQHLLRIVTVVAYGCKTWAAFYSTGKQQIELQNVNIAELEKSVLTLRDTVNNRDEIVVDLQNELTQIQTVAKNGIFVIANSAGFYLTSDYEANEEGDMFLSPATVNFTTDRESAIEFTTEQDAKIALSYFKRWSKRLRIRRLTKEFGLKIDTFFVGSIVLHRVEA
jgi:hypothetical protein